MSDETAFPCTSFNRNGDFLGANNGMTLRDYFAAKALPSLMEMSWPDLQLSPENGLTPIENCAKFAYEAADAMLKARIK